MIKKTMFISIILLTFVGLIIYSISIDSKSFTITTIKKSYSYVCQYNEDELIEVNVYQNNKKTFLNDRNSLSNAYIMDENKENVIKLNVISIDDKNYKTRIKNETYHLFTFLFTIPLETNSLVEINISDCLLVLEYNQRTVEIQIGSFYYVKVPYFGDIDNHLTITKLKPVIDYFGGNKTISGINLIIENNTNSDIRLTNLKLFDNCIFPSFNNSIVIDDYIDKMYLDNNTIGISKIIGYDYLLLGTNDEYNNQIAFNNLIKKKEAKEFLIPIKYLKNYRIDTIGFEIEYSLTETISTTHKLYLDSFLFFTDSKFIINENLLSFYTYESN